MKYLNLAEQLDANELKQMLDILYANKKKDTPEGKELWKFLLALQEEQGFRDMMNRNR